MKILEDNAKIEIIENKINGGYGAGNNVGIKLLYKNYKHVLIANPDVNFIEELVIELLKPFDFDNNCVITSAEQVLPHGKKNTPYWYVPTKISVLFSGLFFFR